MANRKRKRREPLDVTEMFFRNIPRHVKDLFSAYCRSRGSNMKKEFVKFMRTCIGAEEPKQDAA